jgi:hypothetical protein
VVRIVSDPRRREDLDKGPAPKLGSVKLGFVGTTPSLPQFSPFPFRWVYLSIIWPLIPENGVVKLRAIELGLAVFLLDRFNLKHPAQFLMPRT